MFLTSPPDVQVDSFSFLRCKNHVQIVCVGFSDLACDLSRCIKVCGVVGTSTVNAFINLPRQKAILACQNCVKIGFLSERNRANSYGFETF